MVFIMKTVLFILLSLCVIDLYPQEIKLSEYLKQHPKILYNFQKNYDAVDINLDGKKIKEKLKGTLIIDISHQKFLLDVSNNDLTEIIVQEDAYLLSLIARNNKLKKVIFPDFCYMEKVDLGENQLTEFPILKSFEEYKEQRSWKKWPLLLDRGFQRSFEENKMILGISYGFSMISLLGATGAGWIKNRLMARGLQSLIGPHILRDTSLINPLEGEFKEQCDMWDNTAVVLALLGFAGFSYWIYKVINFKEGYKKEIEELKSERDVIKPHWLNVLKLDHNRITKFPKYMHLLKDLKHLDVSHNTLQKIPFCITQCTFDYLNVGYNNLGRKADGSQGTLFDACIQKGTWPRWWRLLWRTKKQTEKLKQALTLHSFIRKEQSNSIQEMLLVSNKTKLFMYTSLLGYLPYKDIVGAQQMPKDIINEINNYIAAPPYQIT